MLVARFGRPVAFSYTLTLKVNFTIPGVDPLGIFLYTLVNRRSHGQPSFNDERSIMNSKVLNSGVYLTPREQQILFFLFTRGCANKVIARLLSISESMVKAHIGNILKKYGAKNRLQLVVFAETDRQQICEA